MAGRGGPGGASVFGTAVPMGAEVAASVGGTTVPVGVEVRVGVLVTLAGVLVALVELGDSVFETTVEGDGDADTPGALTGLDAVAGTGVSGGGGRGSHPLPNQTAPTSNPTATTPATSLNGDVADVRPVVAGASTADGVSAWRCIAAGTCTGGGVGSAGAWTGGGVGSAGARTGGGVGSRCAMAGAGGRSRGRSKMRPSGDCKYNTGVPHSALPLVSTLIPRRASATAASTGAPRATWP